MQQLEDIVDKRLSISSTSAQENAALKSELAQITQEYKHLKETSVEVINELNNSIQVIDDYFKKQNANS